MTPERCVTCGQVLPQNLTRAKRVYIRICRVCKKPIIRHHKYITIKWTKPAIYEFEHRNCADPESYYK